MPRLFYESSQRKGTGYPWQQLRQNYNDYTNRMQQYGSGLMSGVMAGAPITTSGRLASQYRADPNSANVRNYMENILGGQRQALDDYTRQAYNASLASRRGGTGVVGGMDPLSALHQQATQSLASGYANRFQQAMDNEWRGANQALNAWQAQAQLGSGFSDKELSGLNATANWERLAALDDLEREKLAEDTRRWNLQWGRSEEDRLRDIHKEWARATMATPEEREAMRRRTMRERADDLASIMGSRTNRDSGVSGYMNEMALQALMRYFTGQPFTTTFGAKINMPSNQSTEWAPSEQWYMGGSSGFNPRR